MKKHSNKKIHVIIGEETMNLISFYKYTLSNADKIEKCGLDVNKNDVPLIHDKALETGTHKEIRDSISYFINLFYNENYSDLIILTNNESAISTINEHINNKNNLFPFTIDTNSIDLYEQEGIQLTKLNDIKEYGFIQIPDYAKSHYSRYYKMLNDSLKEQILEFFNDENIHPHQSSSVESLSSEAKIEFKKGKWRHRIIE